MKKPTNQTPLLLAAPSRENPSMHLALPRLLPAPPTARQQVRTRTRALALEYGQIQAQANHPGMPLLIPGRGPLAQVRADTLRSPALRLFLGSVLAEREIRTLLAQPAMSPNVVPCTAGELVQRAAARVSFWCVLGRAQCEVLYAATVVAGIGRLLAPTVVGACRVDDVLFTLVRSALHLLDEETPSEAALLRQCLDWGNGDEIDEQLVPGLRRAIARALDHGLDGRGGEADLGWPN